MAIREVRLNFFGSDSVNIRELNGAIGQPFTWFMDGVMRGRFKMYSGNEVKGVNIVNCNLMDVGFEGSNKWETLLNTHQIELPLELKMLQGDRISQITKGIEFFCQVAATSPIPQVKLISTQALESMTSQRIEKAIEKADEYYGFMLEQHRLDT